MGGASTLNTLALEAELETTAVTASAYVSAPLIQAERVNIIFVAAVPGSGVISATEVVSTYVVSSEMRTALIQCDAIASIPPATGVPATKVACTDLNLTSATNWSTVPGPLALNLAVGTLCQDVDGYLKLSG